MCETLDLSDKVRQRKENFRPQAISKNQFENFRKNLITVNNIDQDQIADFKIF